jgi:hypothetical protein
MGFRRGRRDAFGGPRFQALFGRSHPPIIRTRYSASGFSSNLAASKRANYRFQVLSSLFRRKKRS